MRRAYRKVLWLMALFLILYLPLLLLWLAMIPLAIWGAAAILSDLKSNGSFILLVLFIAYVIFSILGIIRYSIFMLKPYRALSKGKKRDNMEITREQAPRLFGMVYSVAEKTGNDYPAHVYLSAEPNASVFFDGRFRNLFLPARKNIEIGLGLFTKMNESEVEACIAHEFGHFSQKTMRAGTIVYILNTFIEHLAANQEYWNSLVNKFIAFPWAIGPSVVASLGLRIAGWIAYMLTAGYQSVMRALYNKIMLANYELSRKMEYEADRVAGEIAGSAVAVSFLCKLGHLSERHAMYLQFLRTIVMDNKFIGDCWRAEDDCDAYLSKIDNLIVTPSSMLSEIPGVIHESRLVLEPVLADHPELKSRIEALKNFDCPVTNGSMEPAWGLVTPEIKSRMSDFIVSRLKDAMPAPEDGRLISEKMWRQKIEEYYYWYPLRHYFNREILEFDPAGADGAGVQSFDFKDPANISVIDEYEVAKKDLLALQAIASGKVKYKHPVYYAGVPYKTKDLPVGEHQKYCDGLKAKALEIDRAICAFLLGHTNERRKILQAYSKMFYAQRFIRLFNDKIEPLTEPLARLLDNTGSSTNSHQYERVRKALYNYDSRLCEVLAAVELEQISKALTEQLLEDIKTKRQHGPGFEKKKHISADSIQNLFQISSYIKDVHVTLDRQSKKFLINLLIAVK